MLMMVATEDAGCKSKSTLFLLMLVVVFPPVTYLSPPEIIKVKTVIAAEKSIPASLLH